MTGADNRPVMKEKMKIFITGATGFIGIHLVKLLAEIDHELRCLVRKMRWHLYQSYMKERQKESGSMG